MTTDMRLGENLTNNARNVLVLIAPSAYLTVRTLSLCNSTQISSKILGGVCLALLALTSLIEAVVRCILLLPALALNLCLEKNHVIREYCIAPIVFGAPFAVENFCNCLVAFVKNFFSNRLNLHYDTLIPCFVDLNTKVVLPACNFCVD